MASGEGRRVLRIQPNSNLRPLIKSRLRGTKQKLRTKSELTTAEQIEKCVEEFANFDGTVENSTAFVELIGLVENATKELLAEEKLFEPVFEKAPVLLCSDDYRIRSAFFRLFRLLLVNEDRLMLYLSLLVDLFATRSLDMLILPRSERMEALRLLARLLSVHLQSSSEAIYSTSTKFPASSLKSIHAVAVHRLILTEPGEPQPEIDELNKAALAVLLEISVLDPVLVIESCSTDWIPRVLVSPGINNFQICGLVCRVLSGWLDDPKIREKAELQLVLEQIFAPLLDLGFFNQADPRLKNSHKITHTLECCANIFMNLMCTWSGFYACASTEPLIGSIASPLKFLSYLGQVKSVNNNLEKIREIVIDVCCDFVCMPYSGKNFVTWSDALVFYSKLHQPDLYEASLRDNFVVGELQSAMALGMDDTDYVDLLLSFRALATFVLINFGLVQSLIRLILTAPNEPMALKATLLLGDLLRTSVSFVPKDWKQLLLSTPALIQLMAQSLLGTVAGKLEKRNSIDLEQSLPSAENSILLLHRLEELSTISKTRPNFLSQLKTANLFVLPHKVGHDRPKGGKFYEDSPDLDGQCSDAISNFLADDRNKWTHFEFLIQHFRNLNSLFHRWQHNDKCHTFFVQVTEFFAPKNQTFLRETVTHEIVKLGSLAFRLMVRLAESEPYYSEILEKYVTDFCRELPRNMVFEGVFSTRNIMHTNVYLYFGIMSAIGSKSYGHSMLERTGFYQLCLDLVTSTTPIEYVKLILSSMNYTKTGITRSILEAGLASTNETGRKWTTRFLEVLLVLQVLPDFEEYGMRLLFQQLADPSGKVIRGAVGVLNKWLPKFPKSLKHLKNVRLETLGDAGILLEVHLYSNEESVRLDEERARSSLKYWTETFNERYVHILEDDMRLALTNFRRSMSGRFARLSTSQKAQQSVRAPAHIITSLAKHQSGLQLMEEENTINTLLTQLRQPLTSEKCLKAKAALLALGHLVGTLNEGVGKQVLPPDTVELMCEYAERCQFLSVRGIAFFALNLAAQSTYGVHELTKIGWESNRHINLQETLSAQLRAQHLEHMSVSNEPEEEPISRRKTPEPELLNVEEFRSSRSNSLYTRAGNEALTALRHRAIQSRRRNTSSCLSRLSETTNEDERLDINSEELEFDVEIYSVLNNPSIKPGELLMRKALKKDDQNRASTLARDSNSRLLQRDFLTYIKGIAVFDKFWLLSDNETNELMAYRNLLDLPEANQTILRTGLGGEKSALEQSLIQNSVGNSWTVCTVPRETQFISDKIFQTDATKLKPDKEQKETIEVSYKPPEAPTNEHNSQQCPYCMALENESSSKFGPLFARFKLTDEMKLDFDKRREDILSSMTMLEVRETTYQTRLANHHKISTVFQHPCVYMDAIGLMNEIKYSLETRSYVQQLFWKCFTQLVEKTDEEE